MMTKEDIVNNPNHYKHGGMETIDEMILVFGRGVVADFCLCNAWKYRARAIYKNGEEDMEKSYWRTLNRQKQLNRAIGLTFAAQIQPSYRREDLNIFLSVWQWNFRKVMKQSWHHDLLCLNAEELS